MENKLCFVQFPHPGSEHKPDRQAGQLAGRAGKSWNRGEHKRTFVKHPGRYLDAPTAQPCDDELMFWCEWEPEADVVDAIKSPEWNGPRFIYEPYYVVPQSYRGYQNTDPFVFGDQFHYAWCKQKTAYGTRSTQLSYLAVGSLILFGSRLNHRFVLDTVFVVERWLDYHQGNYKKVLKGQIAQPYAEVTIAPGYQEHFPGSKVCGTTGTSEEHDGYLRHGLPNKLYFGAMYDRPYAGMYSFFPCLPYGARPNGFARPHITLPDAISDNLGQNFRATTLAQDAITALWDQVVKQVYDQGLMLGVWAAMPERRDSTESQPIKENPSGFHC